jgi:methyltransferase (TIGR00027 family)
MDDPPVLNDPIALQLVGPDHPRQMERAMHPVARDFRAFMAVRSRYVEDQLAQAVARGVRQYVVLGAGLDTFAYRNPFPGLRVFEVDFPATQEWKREMLQKAEIPLPAELTFVPLDFEHRTLAEGLDEAGFDCSKPAFYGWLGVVPYLTLGAFRATVHAIGQMPKGSALAFDYALPPETLSLVGRIAFEALAARVAKAGEPFKLFFSPETLEAEVRAAGFTRLEQLDYAEINEIYFKDRADGLKLSAVKLAMLVTGWV